MKNQLVAFDDARLNASLFTILGLEQELLSGGLEHPSRGWSLIPAGVTSSRKASAAAAASLAAMACGALAIYLTGGVVDRIDRRGETIIASRQAPPVLASSRHDLPPVTSQPSVVPGPSSVQPRGAVSSSPPISGRSRRMIADGAKIAATPSRTDAVRQGVAGRLARLHSGSVSPSIKPIPASQDMPKLAVATPSPPNALDVEKALVSIAERPVGAVTVAAEAPFVRAAARREGVGAIRSFRRQW